MSSSFKIIKTDWPRLLALMLLLTGLSACSWMGSAPDAGQQVAKQLAVAAKGGYELDKEVGLVRQHQVWHDENLPLDVELLKPASPGQYPLIIYMPGLGEDAAAGKIWRERWAKAGYAVFSYQAQPIAQALQVIDAERGLAKHESENDDEIDEDPSASLIGGWFADPVSKPSRTARNSELSYLGHQYFAVDALKNRLRQLNWVSQQLKQRRSEEWLLGVDSARLILAGYDLGAQTVAAAIGEQFDSPLPEFTEFKPLAAILLSPSVNLAKGNLGQRFQAIQLPILVITSQEDNDPYAISSALVRTSIWDYAGSANKYLLLLKDLKHRLLAGTDEQSQILKGLNRSKSAVDFDAEQQVIRKRRRAEQEGFTNDFFPDSGHKALDSAYKQLAAVNSVSLAFLDAVVKKDDLAKFWLSEQATSWLGRFATLKVR